MKKPNNLSYQEIFQNNDITKYDYENKSGKNLIFIGKTKK